MSEFKNINKDQMKKYLKKLLELEAEKYRLEKQKEELKNFELRKLMAANIKNHKDYEEKIIRSNRQKVQELSIIKNQIEQNINSELEKIEKPKEPEIKEPEDSAGCLMILMGILFMFFTIFSSVARDSDNPVGTIISIITIGIVFIIIGKSILDENDKKHKVNKKTTETYQSNLKNYQEYLLKYRKDLEIKYENLNKEDIKTIEEKYEQEKEKRLIQKNKKEEIINHFTTKNKELIKNTQENLEIVNDKLEKLYSIDIIFEKYRNLTAISMFYEYFASSRVSELEGRDGAYNLFETEIRQNIIIVKLNDIAEHLEEIKQNQYCMYKELVNINESLKELNEYTYTIGLYINNIDKNVYNINETEKYISHCSNEINKNINTIKNIAIADFLFK